MTDEQTEIEQDSSDRYIRSNNFISLYVNNTNCGYTKFDIQMIFSKTQVTMTNLPTREEVAVVAMSPQHAKALLKALEATLKRYEKNYGEIILSDSPKAESEKTLDLEEKSK
jgi:Protein of unknown function (DUF3467)